MQADVSATVALVGALLFALYLFVIPFGCCCRRSTRRPCVFIFAWVLGTASSALLWHGLGQHTSDGGAVVVWRPWTAAWSPAEGTTLTVPATEEELRSAVLASPRPLRAVGGGHSWSMTSHTTGTFIDMRRFDAIAGFDARLRRVRVQAGMRVQQAVQFLLERGLCLHGVGSIREQFVGGVISHGVHGPTKPVQLETTMCEAHAGHTPCRPPAALPDSGPNCRSESPGPRPASGPLNLNVSELFVNSYSPGAFPVPPEIRDHVSNHAESPPPVEHFADFDFTMDRIHLAQKTRVIWSDHGFVTKYALLGPAHLEAAKAEAKVLQQEALAETRRASC